MKGKNNKNIALLAFLSTVAMSATAVGVTTVQNEPVSARSIMATAETTVAVKENATKGYDIVIYNGDGTVGMTIDGTNSISDFNLKTALESAYSFANNGSLFGITGDPTYEVIFYQDLEVTEMVAIPAGKNIVINLNGHAITSGYQTGSDTKHIYPLDVYGNLTIKDDVGTGSITGRGIFVQDGSKLTVKSGKIYGIDSNGGSALFQYGGDIVIDGGLIEQKAEGTYNFAINANNGTVTVNGGKVAGNHGAVAAGGATVVLNGGEFVCTGTAGMTDNVLYSYDDGSITINGGTFVADNDGPAGGCCVYDANGKTVINDGNFSNSSGGDVWGTTGTTINGGTFENLTENAHVTLGATIVNGGKTYVKTENGLEEPKAAKVGNTEYKTIDEAIAAWTSTKNSTLTLMSDVTLSDVVTLKSTEHHILNLGTYTMTAASGKNAFVIQACGNGSAERTAITINADATNPGGINAGSKCVVYYKYADGGISTEDRPIIQINGGVFTGSTSTWGTAGIYTIGSAARKCATLNITGGTFNCSINGSGKSKLLISGGTFNYSVGSQGDSTALRLISGGTFKTIGFMTADSNNTKFWFGTSMGNSNVGVYVDDNGYIVVGGPVITEAGDKFEASSTNYSGASSYLQYSSAKTNGLYYTSVEEALADNTSGKVTVYADEADLTGINFKGTIVVPEGSKLTVKNAPANLKVTNTAGETITPNANGTYSTITPDGNDFIGYTSTDGIWGEVWGNASESFVIKVLDANGNVMGTTSLNNVGGIIDGDVTVSWNLKLDAASNTDEYWTMEWTTAPSINNMPAKVELWVDGVKVSGGNVVLNGPDDLNKIYAATADADGNITKYYTTFEAAVAAATAGDQIVLLNDVTLSEALTLPAGVIFNGNGKQVNGTLYAGGDLTFVGHTKVTAFSASYYDRTITIGEGACLEVTGTGRVTLGYGNTFNITGSIENAKTATMARADVQPSLIIPGGMSITGGNNATMNVTNAYIKVGGTTSKPGVANGTFTMNFTNSIVDFTKEFGLYEPTSGMNPTFNVTIKDSIFTTGTKLCIAAPNSNVVIDNSVVTLGSYIRNSGNLTLKNSSELTGKTIQFGENGGNNGTIIVDNSALTIGCGDSTAHALDGKGTGNLILVNGATAEVEYFTGMTVAKDATSTFTSKTEQGAQALVAKVGNTYYTSFEAAIAAAKAGDTVTIFAGTYAVPTMKAGITVVGEGEVVLEGTLTGSLENLTLKNLHIKGSSAQRWAYAKGDLVFENVTFEATSVYAIHFDGITADATLTYTDCTIIGWAAMGGSPASCVFEDCTFKGNGTYGLIRTYFNATITNCTFDVANVNTNDKYQDGIHAVEGAKVTVTGCTNVNGSMADLVNVHANSVVELDGKKIQNVAKVGVNYYTSIEEAFKAATDGCTIEILADVVIDYKWDCRDYATNGSHSQFNESVTINGNGHTIKFTNTINDNNWNTVFRFEENATVKNLTIDISEATGTQRIITAKKSLTVDGLTIVGSAKYGIIFGESASAADLAATEIVIKNSTLTGTRRAISDNEGGKDVKSVVITGNTLNANAYASASESIVFNNNTAAGEVDLRSYTAENVLSVEAKGNTLNTAVKNYIYAKEIDAQEDFTTKRPAIKVATKAELNAAIAEAKEGDTITLTADIDYGTDQLAIAKAITLDLGGKTLTTRNAWGGMSIKGNATVKNGTIVHASNTAAIKVWNATAFENLVIDVQGKGDAGKTIGGIVLQSGSTTKVGSIKNVTIKGAALTNGIETYNCGDASENVIGAMENVTIDAKGTGMLISAPCGTATNCTINGAVNGIEIWIKGNYSASLDLVDCDVEGGVYAHDEFNNNAGVVNNGTLTLTADEDTTGADVTLELARAEDVGGLLKEIKDNAQAKLNNTYYATIEKAIAAAKAGDTVTIFEGTYAVPAMKAGIKVVGEGKVLLEGTLSGTLENLTLKNLHIKGANAQRWAYAKGDLVFENVTFEATSVYALHFDGIADGTNLTYKNCTIIGWAAMGGSPASCVFEGCTIKGNGSYGVIRTYFDATITNCTFDVAKVNTNDQYQDGIHAVEGAEVTVTGCTNVNGDMVDLVNVHANSVVVVDGVEIKNVAKIGDTYYATVAEAMKAAQAGDTVTIFAGTYAMPAMKAGITVVGEGKVLLEGTLSGTLENLTLKNLHIKGANAQRWAYAKGNLVFENVTFEATSVYALHFDGIATGTNLTYKNCTIIGWAAMGGSPASCVFEGCTIKGNGSYGVIRTYFDATITNCTFDVAKVNTNDQYQDGIHAVEGAVVTVDNCTNVNGDMADLVNVHANSVVVLDRVEIKNVAKIGDKYYTSFAEAFANAENGATIDLLADVTASEVILIGKNVTINGNNHKVTSSATRVFRVTVGGVEVTLNNVNMVSTAVRVGTNDIRGISIDIVDNVKLTLNGCSVDFTDASANDWTYAVNVTGGSNHAVTVNGGTYEGANVINAHGANNTIVVKNATLNCLYPNNDMYAGACIWVLQNQGSSVEATGNTFNGSNAVAFNLGTGTTLTESNNVDSTTMVVAKIGDVYYTSLADAFAVGGEVKLLHSVKLSETLTVPARVTVVLDLNGKTISQSKACTASYEMINNKGNLTITGNGKISFTDTSAGDPTYGWGSYTVRNEGTLVVENGTIEHLGAQTQHMYCAIFQYCGSTTINGGTISTPNYRSVRLWKGEMEINGGTFNGQVWVQAVDSTSDLTINGGTFAPAGGDASAVFVTNSTYDVEFAVTGGTFNGKIGTSDANALAGAITGGLFNEAAVTNTNVALLGNGFVFGNEANANGYYGIVAGLRGAGTEANPYVIANVDDLTFFRDSVNAGETKYNAPGVYVKLTANIDMAGATWERGIGDGINATFDGIFDGGNFTIKNLNLAPTADNDGYFCGGLFGYTYGEAQIKNLVLENITVTATGEGHNVGALVGFANNKGGKLNVSNVTVKNVTINAPKAYGVGAIVGYSYRAMGTIANCSVDGATITGYSFVGGITGYSYNDAVITGCSVKNATITATSKGAGGIAGIVLGGNKVSGNTVENTTVTAATNWGSVVGEIASEGILIENNTAEGKQVGGAYSTGKPVQAVIGNKYYTTFAAAYEAAQAGDIITLLEGVVVNAEEELTLNKDVTITYTSNVAGEDMFTVRGKLNISAGTITYKNTDTKASNVTVSTISCEPGSVLNVTGGTIVNDSANNGSIGIYAYAIDMLTNGNMGDVTVNISGGKISSTNYMAIRQFNNGTACKNTLNITDGEVYGAKRAIQVHLDNNAAYTTISGGTIKAGDYALCIFATKSGALSVTGGNFIGTVYSATEGFISGGTFSTDVSEYCANGLTAEKQADGSYSIKTAVAMVGENAYATLAEAVTNANDATITLLADVAISESLTVAAGKSVTFDLNGKTITGTDTTTKNFGLIMNDGTLTIIDSVGGGKITLEATVNSGWNRYSAVISNNPGGTLVVNGGTFEHLGGTDMAYGIDSLTNGNIGEVSVTINGGTIKSTYRAIRQFLNSATTMNELIINGGTIEGANKSIFFHDPSTKANVGELTIGENATLKGDVYLFVTENSTEWPVEVSINENALADGSNVVSKNVPQGYIVQVNNGVYGVMKAVAMIGENGYATLAEAFAAVADGETITLLAGEFSEGSIKMPATLKNVTIKGAADHASILKDMTIMAADGNSINYQGLTFDGIVFENSRISLTGWRTNGTTMKDITVTNCIFKNLNDTTNSAAVHVNVAEHEAVENFTFTNNVIDGATGGSKSGLYLQATGNVVVTNNVINNVAFRPYVIQLTSDDGIEDNFVVTGNTFSGSAVGRAQGLANNAEGTDKVTLVVSKNIFKGITDAQQICYWNFNAETTTWDLSKNYYDINIEENPGKIYMNNSCKNNDDLIAAGVTSYYAELNADDTINEDSLVEVKEETKFYAANLTVGVDLSVNFYVKSAEDLSGVVMNFKLYNWYTKADVEKTATGVAEKVNGVNVYKFTFKGVGPHLMGQKITATLGTLTFDYSIKDYAHAQLAMNDAALADSLGLSLTAEDGSLNELTVEKLRVYRTFLANLMNYGAESQIFQVKDNKGRAEKDENGKVHLYSEQGEKFETTLVTDDLSNTALSYITHYHAVAALEGDVYATYEPANVRIRKVVTFASTNSFRLYFTECDNNVVTKWVVKAYGPGYRGKTLEWKQDGAYYYVEVSNIRATEFDNNYDFFIFEADGVTPVVGYQKDAAGNVLKTGEAVISYSVQQYVYNTQNTTKTAAPLTVALWNYYHAAEDYIDEFTK